MSPRGRAAVAALLTALLVPAARGGEPATTQALAGHPLLLAVLDEEPYAVSLRAAPESGTLWLVSPGLPFALGDADVKITDVAGSHVAGGFRQTVSWRPVADTIEVPVRIPDQLPPGTYDVRVDARLYGVGSDGLTRRSAHTTLEWRREGEASLLGVETAVVVVGGYAFNDANPSEDQAAQWRQTFADAARVQLVDVTLFGHACSRGTDDQNNRKGQARADAVRAIAIASGIAPDLVHAYSAGADEPLAHPVGIDPELARYEDRRVVARIRFRRR